MTQLAACGNLLCDSWVICPASRCHEVEIQSSSLLFLLLRRASGEEGSHHDTKLTWSCDHENGIMFSPMSLTTLCGVSPQRVLMIHPQFTNLLLNFTLFCFL